MLSPPDNILDAQILAQAIVNTTPEPFLVLDGQLRVLAASRSFYAAFKVDPEQTHGCLLYDFGGRPVGHSGAPAAARNDYPRTDRDGRVRGRT